MQHPQTPTIIPTALAGHAPNRQYNSSKRQRDPGVEHYHLLMKTPYAKLLETTTSTTPTIPPLLAAMTLLYDTEPIETSKLVKPDHVAED